MSDTTPKDPDDRPDERTSPAGREAAPGPDPTTMNLPSIGDVRPAEGGAEAEHVLTRADQAMVEALRPGTALLVVLRGPNTGARFLLDDDQVLAGRHPDCDIFLDDVTVSRRHAVFERREHAFVVRDVGSLNGTYVNRSIVDETPLQTGDEVQIGKFRLVFYAGRG